MGAASSQSDPPVRKQENLPSVKQSLMHNSLISAKQGRFSFGTGNDVSMIAPSTNEPMSPDQPRPLRQPIKIKSRVRNGNGQASFWESFCLPKGNSEGVENNKDIRFGKHKRQSSTVQENMFLSKLDTVAHDIRQNPQLRSSRLNNTQYLSIMSPQSYRKVNWAQELLTELTEQEVLRYLQPHEEQRFLQTPAGDGYTAGDAGSAHSSALST